jgi:hypothetical protein
MINSKAVVACFKELSRHSPERNDKNYENGINVVGFEVFKAVVMKSIIFWDVTPRSLFRCNRRFGGTYRPLATCLLAGLAEMFSSTLKMEATCFSETSVASQQTTRHHIPEDHTLQS